MLLTSHHSARQLSLPWCRLGTGKANDDSLRAVHLPAHLPPLAQPLNEAFAQQGNVAGARYFHLFPSKLFPNLTAELEAPHSTPSTECCKPEIAIAST